jgi:hypothetical protein
VLAFGRLQWILEKKIRSGMEVRISTGLSTPTGGGIRAQSSWRLVVKVDRDKRVRGGRGVVKGDMVWA